MAFEIDIYFTLALAAAALVIGRLLTVRVGFLARYSVPDAVVGGMLIKGGRVLLVFFAIVAAALALQNAIGVTLATLFDIHPVNGLLAGSITLAGGHGTGAAWATKFVEERNLQGAVELAVPAPPTAWWRAACWAAPSPAG